MIELLYDDVERHGEAIRSRLELAAGDVLADGKFELVQENGLTLEVDWGAGGEYADGRAAVVGSGVRSDR
ncbi:hypothetical protein [Streptomyces sp. BP-8]|uniref:Uncharacterized protein n=1 Tax=Streptomyces sirii TaxID=3127701 RepID=A0ABZ2R3T7_9ACTN